MKLKLFFEFATSAVSLINSIRKEYKKTKAKNEKKKIIKAMHEHDLDSLRKLILK